MKPITRALYALACCAATSLAAAQPAPAASAPAAQLADGEVRKVDTATGRITIRHGEIRHLDMPPMTMVFRAGDAALLQQVKPGDRIRFRAEKVEGGYAVTAVEPAAP